MVIYVDADAAPRDVMQTTKQLAHEFGAELVTVSSINHELDGEHHITVDAVPQATDMRIVSMVEKGVPTVVITQDYGLAALVLGKGARAISPSGMEFTEDNIDRLLFERALHAHERRATGRNRGGPKARTKENTRAFDDGLRRILQQMSS